MESSRVLQPEGAPGYQRDPEATITPDRRPATEPISCAGTMTAWNRVELARHKDRPKMLDYVSRMFDDFVDMHGDRLTGDDSALIGGIARFRDQTVVLVGQQKGTNFEDRMRRNFGMARPNGYRKALRLFEMAERLQIPIVSLVDTPAADPHPDSERGGQGPAIAQNILRMLSIKTPIYCAVLGEGGSGGALGIAVADKIVMMENAIYVVCPPERCAEILWKDIDRRQLAATAMNVTADDLLRLGVVDAVIDEPGGGAHLNPEAAAENLAESLDDFLASSRTGDFSPSMRQERFRAIGQWQESAATSADA
ncbi:MAG: acetyl-coenzyme A carboxylase carboxyl transferase subunit alpha [Phycisphaerae bacterium]|nr:MAG: acetyl-coenzyme A carboxylase carboxyl transferase subunit alpha [Phycisphaerae bacterium]